MRKQEYVHVHALLAELSQELGQKGVISSEDLAEYRALDTKPSNINYSKEDHHEAVMVLADTLTQPPPEKSASD